MGDKNQRPFLRLVDDPVVRVMQMLRQLPLEAAVGYLEMIAELAGRMGLLDEADRERIAELVRQAAARHIDRAA
jgi:hypothetical protein